MAEVCHHNYHIVNNTSEPAKYLFDKWTYAIEARFRESSEKTNCQSKMILKRYFDLMTKYSYGSL